MSAGHEDGMSENQSTPSTVDLAAMTHDELAAWRRVQAERKTLACPYCGSELSIYPNGDGDVTIDCENSAPCGGRWTSSKVDQTPAEFQSLCDSMVAWVEARRGRK